MKRLENFLRILKRNFVVVVQIISNKAHVTERKRILFAVSQIRTPLIDSSKSHRYSRMCDTLLSPPLILENMRGNARVLPA